MSTIIEPSAIQYVKITVDYTLFSAATPTRTKTIFTPAANQLVLGAVMQPTTGFTGGTIATYTISLGQTTPIDVLGASSVKSVPTNCFIARAVNATRLSAPSAISATATATGDTLDNASAGVADIWLEIVTLS